MYFSVWERISEKDSNFGKMHTLEAQISLKNIRKETLALRK